MYKQKNQFLLTTVLFALSGILSASSTSQEGIRQQNKAYLAKLGIQLLDGEVKIVEANSLLKETKDAHYASKIHQYLSMHQEQEKKGFVNSQSPRAKELLELPETVKYQYKKYKNTNSQHSTHLRHSIPELTMAYTFIGVPSAEMDEYIGIAPYGAYKQTKYGDDGDGWDGAVQFFVKKDIGTCEFKEHNMKIAHGGVEIIKELVSYEINNKPSVVLVQGTKETGYLYKVTWYDNTFSRELSCANTSFSQETKQKVIELAQKIESIQ